MFSFFNKGKTAGDLVSLKTYRHLRDEAKRQLDQLKEDAKSELEASTIIPVQIYRKTVEQAQEDFRRIEQEYWNDHLERMKN